MLFKKFQLSWFFIYVEGLQYRIHGRSFIQLKKEQDKTVCDLYLEPLIWLDISNEDISIIKHAGKSILFNHGKPWIENGNSNSFNVIMGSYDGAEICELVGLFILNHLGKMFGKQNIGLYKDDGLAIIKNRSVRLAEKTRKELHKVFKQFGLKITAEANLHVVNFLDLTFDLTTEKYKPYRKPNDDPLYIHKHSNHPPRILRQLPASIKKRISTLSSDKQEFDDAAQTYQNAL